jgi:hypothetical protein
MLGILPAAGSGLPQESVIPAVAAAAEEVRKDRRVRFGIAF